MRKGRATHRSIVNRSFLAPRRRSGTAVLDHNTVPTAEIRIRQRPQDALVGVDAREEERAEPARLKGLGERRLAVPEARYAILVAEDVRVRSARFLQRSVQGRVPRARHQQAASALAHVRAEAESGLLASSGVQGRCDKAPGEAARGSCGHGGEVVIV